MAFVVSSRPSRSPRPVGVQLSLALHIGQEGWGLFPFPVSFFFFFFFLVGDFQRARTSSLLMAPIVRRQNSISLGHLVKQGGSSTVATDCFQALFRIWTKVLELIKSEPGNGCLTFRSKP
jgi:hypothetical protein